MSKPTDEQVNKAADMTRLLLALYAKLTGRNIVVKPLAIERVAAQLKQEAQQNDG